ncbi:MAG: hydroxymethylbilane synthase [Gammaproteobacteria bacterium]|nr:hydroxymethylbilane synthase [Gammaproteobacteria bacterium]
MPARATLRLGTRASLLAVAQSRLVARAIRAADPGIAVELVTVETRGDRDRATPLSAVRDPGFFSAALDEALRDGRVDLCVHSMKDLPLEARAGIRTVAVPPREDPRDVVVFRPDVAERLAAGERLRIGSSSARRAAFAAEFLAGALPQAPGGAPALDFPPLRGPVEERLAQLRRSAGAPGAIDGAVLALAGLARLWGDRDGHAALAPLLAGTRLMVLPLTTCPTAPAQGALAVDCRDDDTRVARILAPVHDAASARRAARERALLAAQPPAGRDGFGATTLRHEHCGTLVFVRAADTAGRHLLWQEPPQPCGAVAWDGAEWVRASRWHALAPVALGTPPALFVAHWHALAPELRLPATTRLWVSGVGSWRRLAARGLWVEGCADHLGFAALVPTLAAPVLRLPPLGEWAVVTRRDALASWEGSGVGRVLATYEIDAPADATALETIRNEVAGATHFFWGSAAQFRALRDWLPANSHHACGPGKTYQALRADGVANLHPFPSREEWRAWVA